MGRIKAPKDAEGGDSHEEAQFCDNHSADSVTVHDKCASGGDAGDMGVALIPFISTLLILLLFSICSQAVEMFVISDTHFLTFDGTSV